MKAWLLKLWDRRTTVLGYAGVIFGAIEGVQGGTWKMMWLAVIVAVLGHYNQSLLNRQGP